MANTHSKRIKSRRKRENRRKSLRRKKSRGKRKSKSLNNFFIKDDIILQNNINTLNDLLDKIRIENLKKSRRPLPLPKDDLDLDLYKRLGNLGIV